MSEKMTNEQKLELIAMAMELGAKLNIYFYHNTKEEAEHIADELALGFEDRSSDNFKWLNHFDYNNGIEFSVFYEPEEKEEELPFADESIFLEDDVFLDDPHAS